MVMRGVTAAAGRRPAGGVVAGRPGSGGAAGVPTRTAGATKAMADGREVGAWRERVASGVAACGQRGRRRKQGRR